MTRAGLATAIAARLEAGDECEADAVARRQLDRGSRLALEDRSASAIAYFNDGTTTLRLSDAADYGRRQKDSALLGAKFTYQAAQERRADLVGAISPIVHEMRGKDPSISDNRIATRLVGEFSHLCRYQFSDGIEKTYSVRHLRRIIAKDLSNN